MEMKEVTILALYGSRPDFIEPQYESMKKHLKDDFKFIVVNNSYFGCDKPELIDECAKEQGLQSVRIKHNGTKTEASALVRDSLNFLWKEFKNTKGILAIIDCDLFFTNDISFNLILEGNDMAFCPIYTNGKVWPWTGLMLFDMDKLHVDDVSFSFESLDGDKYQDVGSALNNYIQKHDPNIYLIDRKEILNSDWALKGKESLQTLGFPQPYSCDIISVVQYPFMFHYKTSSNYAPHCTPQYNMEKSIALDKLLKL